MAEGPGRFVFADPACRTRPEIGIGTPRGAASPTPPGIRITYHGGSTGLSLDRDIETGETERLEVLVGQGLLDCRVS